MFKKLCFASALICTTLSGTTSAAGGIEYTFQSPNTQSQKLAYDEIRASRVNQLVGRLSNEHFPFTQTLTIHYGGEDGPLYDPDLHTIFIPYAFYTQAIHYFAQNRYQKMYGKSAKEAAIDTILHTLLHEVGHAYIDDNGIPILGKEEDAVDNFAAIVLINYVKNGADIAISAADMFAFESDDKPDYYDSSEYIDEHSFDLQRYFSTLCLVYGAEPKQYPNLLDEINKLDVKDRQTFCIEHYQTMSENWQKYFKTVK
ncbi:TPA: DUF4344 domain-containing metallopeptidase [Photobacterium damselae]